MADVTRRDSQASAWTEEMAFTRTEDGLLLEGVVIRPAGADGGKTAVVWIHGGASKFCERHYIMLGRELAARGYAFVAGNTRGHDVATIIWKGDQPMAAGATWERFDESPLDIGAWLGIAAGLCFERVVLAGHSLGASKAVYYQAHTDDSRVSGLIAASPAVGWMAMPERVALAQTLVTESRGEELLPHLEGTPACNIVSAQMVVTREEIIRDSFDAQTGEPHVASVRCPLLVVYGADEDVGVDWLETIRRNAWAAATVDVQVLEGAGHDYAGREAAAADIIAGWIAGLR